MNINRAPKRSTEQYHELKRSVAVNYYKAEVHKEPTSPDKKKPHEPGNVLSKFMSGSWIVWIISYVRSRFWFKHRFLSYKGLDDNGIYPIGDDKPIKIALASDWATDTVEAKNIAEQIINHQPDYTIHLGDTYFVGDKKEIRNNFTPGDSFWPYGKSGSFSLIGNHEMYSNGYGYFNHLLGWMGLYQPQREPQKASYFCLETTYWQIIGLDTGYRSVGIPLVELLLSKADLRSEILEWLEKVVNIKVRKDKGLVLLTHHQYASTFDKSYPATAKQLAGLLENRKALWFWGHEHRFAMYGRLQADNGFTLYGRCIGHGGMPVDVVDESKAKVDSSANLVIFDNRPCKPVNDKYVGHNGYAVLNIEGNLLEVNYYDEKDLLVTEKWEYNTATRSIEGKTITRYNNNDLTLKQDLDKAIK